MTYVSGDANSNSLLEPTETWTYTCSSGLTATSTSASIAAGTANGMTVRDIAVATVVVATLVPKLPNTGFVPASYIAALVALAISLVAAILIIARRRIY